MDATTFVTWIPSAALVMIAVYVVGQLSKDAHEAIAAQRLDLELRALLEDDE